MPGIDEIFDAIAVDQQGNKIGAIGQVYLDDHTGEPTWVSVKTGLFGLKETFAPLHNSVLADGKLRLPYSAEKVKDAPRVDPDMHLDAAEEAELYRYYSIHAVVAGDGQADQQSPTADAGLAPLPEQPHAMPVGVESENPAGEDAVPPNESAPAAPMAAIEETGSAQTPEETAPPFIVDQSPAGRPITLVAPHEHSEEARRSSDNARALIPQVPDQSEDEETAQIETPPAGPPAPTVPLMAAPPYSAPTLTPPAQVGSQTDQPDPAAASTGEQEHKPELTGDISTIMQAISERARRSAENEIYNNLNPN